MTIDDLPLPAVHNNDITVKYLDLSSNAYLVLEGHGHRCLGIQVRIKHSVKEICFHGAYLMSPID